MNITLYGTGYVGLVTGACFAELGHHVLCVDIDTQKIARLKQGEIPIFEPGLDNIVAQNIASSRLEFTSDYRLGVAHGLIQMITVNTPTNEDGSANIQYLLNCAHTIAEHMKEYRLIVNKSTAPVGTVNTIKKLFQNHFEKSSMPIPFHVASNPEFLREGAAVRDFLDPDRIIIGTDHHDAKLLLEELYASFNQEQTKVIHMDIESAELTKYAANAILATKISFINEMANLAEQVGADIHHVRRGLALDPRIGPHFISPGCGYGGSCFPKDVKALIHMLKEKGLAPHMLQAVEQVNAVQKQKLFEKIQYYFENRHLAQSIDSQLMDFRGGAKRDEPRSLHLVNEQANELCNKPENPLAKSIEGKTIALWGLAFKPNTNDIRDASSRVLMEQLWQAGAFVKAYDPAAMNEIQEVYPNQEKLALCPTKEACLEQADALVICTEWAEFCNARLEEIKPLLKNPVIFDGRNIFNREHALELGFDYFGIGR